MRASLSTSPFKPPFIMYSEFSHAIPSSDPGTRYLVSVQSLFHSFISTLSRLFHQSNIYHFHPTTPLLKNFWHSIVSDQIQTLLLNVWDYIANASQWLYTQIIKVKLKAVFIKWYATLAPFRPLLQLTRILLFHEYIMFFLTLRFCSAFQFGRKRKNG